MMLLLALLLGADAYPAPKTPIEVVRVVDGDTLVANIPGWPDVVGKRIHIRIMGIDAPELHGAHSDHELEDAKRAKSRLEKWLAEAKEVRLTAVYRDKYYRLLADISVDGRDVGKRLLAARLAQPYEGGTKVLWDDWSQRSAATPIQSGPTSSPSASVGMNATDSGSPTEFSPTAPEKTSSACSGTTVWSMRAKCGTSMPPSWRRHRLRRLNLR